MDYLWTPWRYRYITQAARARGCIFCQARAARNDSRAGILYRGRRNFIILNRFPYTTGHVMIVPYRHLRDLAAADTATLHEMMELSRRVQLILGKAYRAEGFNLGINLGKCAGAGVAGHLHIHVLPRWTGDTNFMTVLGETRVQPEDLETTYKRLKPYFAERTPAGRSRAKKRRRR